MGVGVGDFRTRLGSIWYMEDCQENIHYCWHNCNSYFHWQICLCTTPASKCSGMPLSKAEMRFMEARNEKFGQDAIGHANNERLITWFSAKGKRLM